MPNTVKRNALQTQLLDTREVGGSLPSGGAEEIVVISPPRPAECVLFPPGFDLEEEIKKMYGALRIPKEYMRGGSPTINAARAMLKRG